MNTIKIKVPGFEADYKVEDKGNKITITVPYMRFWENNELKFYEVDIFDAYQIAKIRRLAGREDNEL